MAPVVAALSTAERPPVDGKGNAKEGAGRAVVLPLHVAVNRGGHARRALGRHRMNQQGNTYRAQRSETDHVDESPHNASLTGTSVSMAMRRVGVLRKFWEFAETTHEDDEEVPGLSSSS
jgi:hypothetical protein